LVDPTVAPVGGSGTCSGSGASVGTVAKPSVEPTKDAEERKAPVAVAREKRSAAAAAIPDASSPTNAPGGHLPQKKRKVKIEEDGSEGAGTTTQLSASDVCPSAPTEAITIRSTPTFSAPMTPSVPSAAGSSVKKEGIRQECDGKWSASVLHTDGRSYQLGACFETHELATLALGAFRSTLANESRAAGGRISEAMVKQAREMAHHAVLAKSEKGASDQK